MENEKIKYIKNNKPFKKFDIVIYVLIIVIIFSLFLAFIIIPKSTSINGFTVYHKNNLIYTFDFTKNTYKIESGWEDKIVILDKENNTFSLTIYIDNEKQDFNEFIVDKNKKTVKCENANCLGKDCTFIPAIGSSSGAIICIPHEIKVTGLGKVSPVIG